MRNRLPGTCYRCEKFVEVGDGHFEKAPGGWRLQHAACCLKARAEKAVRAARQARKGQLEPDAPVLRQKRS